MEIEKKQKHLQSAKKEQTFRVKKKYIARHRENKKELKIELVRVEARGKDLVSLNEYDL